MTLQCPAIQCSIKCVLHLLVHSEMNMYAYAAISCSASRGQSFLMLTWKQSRAGTATRACMSISHLEEKQSVTSTWWTSVSCSFNPWLCWYHFGWRTNSWSNIRHVCTKTWPPFTKLDMCLFFLIYHVFVKQLISDVNIYPVPLPVSSC